MKIKIEKLNLQFQTILEKKMECLKLPFSEYSFANLYLFRHLHNYEVLTVEKEIFIRGITRDHIPFIMLTSQPKDISKNLLDQAKQNVQMIFPVSEEWKSQLTHLCMQASYKEEDSDYIYESSKLATYPGRHLDGKRNQVKQFLEHYQVKIRPYDSQNGNLKICINHATEILFNWQKEHQGDPNDFASCLEAINNMDELKLNGFIVYADGKPGGFIIGGRLNKDYYVVHFSKALHAIKGIYQYLYQKMAQRVQDDHKWINLEQDLGLAPLRESKHSYHPANMAIKWRMFF